MSKWPDWVALILAVLATVWQLLILLAPGLPVLPLPVLLTVLVMCLCYFFVVRPLLTPAAPEAPLPSPAIVAPDYEASYKYVAGRYGMGYDRLEVDCTIGPDGSALVQRKVTLEAYSETGELDAFLLIPESQPPGEEAREITPVGIKSLSPGWDVSLAEISKALGSLYTVIKVSPPLSEGQSITYQMTEMLPSNLYAIGLTEEELAARETPYDYFGWNINRPTRKLSLRVWFPEGVKPDVYSGEVRYASAAPGFPSERLQHEEQKRLKRPSLAGPEGNRYVLKLDVDYPMIGLIYVLRWRPPVKKAEESTRPAE